MGWVSRMVPHVTAWWNGGVRTCEEFRRGSGPGPRPAPAQPWHGHGRAVEGPRAQPPAGAPEHPWPGPGRNSGTPADASPSQAVAASPPRHRTDLRSHLPGGPDRPARPPARKYRAGPTTARPGPRPRTEGPSRAHSGGPGPTASGRGVVGPAPSGADLIAGCGEPSGGCPGGVRRRGEGFCWRVNGKALWPSSRRVPGTRPQVWCVGCVSGRCRRRRSGRRSPRRTRPWRGGGGAWAARRRPRGGGR